MASPAAALGLPSPPRYAALTTAAAAAMLRRACGLPADAADSLDELLAALTHEA